MADKPDRHHTQTVLVIRHGERIDHVDYRWVRRSERPYDPPLTEQGVKEAKQAGKRLKGKDIHSVISSPFLRCLQTAQHICDALDLPGIITCNAIVDVLLPNFGIHQEPVVPADNIAELGISVIKYDLEPLPTYPDDFNKAMKRYTTEINKLADEYWPKNIMIVTHMYAVTQALAMTRSEQCSDMYADYCSYVEMARTSKQSHRWQKQTTFSIKG